MNSKPQYTLKKYPHGYLVMEPFPIYALKEIAGMVPKGAVISPGIASHYKATLCIGMPSEIKTWEAEIEDELKALLPQKRWLRGTKVGISSLTIFVALTDSTELRSEAEHQKGGFSPGIPYDSDDFSRCHYLLNQMPKWKERLGEVGVKFPSTKWNKIVPIWPELESLFKARKHSELYKRIEAVR